MGEAFNRKKWFADPQWSNTWGEVNEWGYAGIQTNGDPVAATVTKIIAWQQDFGGDKYIVRMEFYYTDSRIGVNGMQYVGLADTNGSTMASSVEFLSGELIKSAVAWTNRQHGAYINRGYQFTTSLGRVVTLGISDAELLDASRLGDQDGLAVGCGLLIGARSGKGQRRFMSLLFLDDVASVELTVDKYVEHPPNIKLKDFQTIRSKNNTAKDGNMVVSVTHAKTVSYEWSIALTVGLKVSVTIKASIPEVVEVSETLEYTWSTTMTDKTTETRTDTLLWSQSNATSPHAITTATLSYGQGNVQTTYTGTLKVYMSNGNVFTAPVTGAFVADPVGVTQIAWSSAPITTTKK